METSILGLKTQVYFEKKVLFAIAFCLKNVTLIEALKTHQASGVKRVSKEIIVRKRTMTLLIAP